MFFSKLKCVQNTMSSKRKFFCLAGIISASGEQLKLWSSQSLQCIRSLECEYALCCGLLRGDRHAVVGTKTGKMQLFDLAAGELTESVDAHQGACWSLCFMPDKKGLVSGGSDKLVKFWDVEINKEARKFTLKLVRYTALCILLNNHRIIVTLHPGWTDAYRGRYALEV